MEHLLSVRPLVHILQDQSVLLVYVYEEASGTDTTDGRQVFGHRTGFYNDTLYLYIDARY